jgi:hypothetical protein
MIEATECRNFELQVRKGMVLRPPANKGAIAFRGLEKHYLQTVLVMRPRPIVIETHILPRD